MEGPEFGFKLQRLALVGDLCHGEDDVASDEDGGGELPVGGQFSGGYREKNAVSDCE